ncbi:ATP-dependent DNA ligase [Saccharopolyspora tripterygii]
MVVLHPPIPVAVAARTQEVPSDRGRWAFEPKLDGYRVIAFAGLGLLQSRQGRTGMTTRFPEVTADLAALGRDVVLDGELVALRGEHLEFAALQTGPARRTREHVTVIYMAFDLLATGDEDLRTRPYLDRRAALADLLAHPRPHLQLVTHTLDPNAAREWLDPSWGEAGIEGLVAKPVASRYMPGSRSGWLKIRQLVTTEAVVLGVVGAASLLLGRPSSRGGWRASGVSQPVSARLRAELAARLRPDAEAPTLAQLPGVVAGLPGGEPVVYLPVHPDVVVEVIADTAVEYGRWRHRPTIVRIREDLTPDELRFRASRPD